MRLAVVGSRGFTDYNLLRDAILSLWITHSNLVIISDGTAALAKYFALSYNIGYIEFLPEGKKDKRLINECDTLIAFWDGKSKGTKHSIDLAEKADKLYKIVRYKDD